MLVPHHYFWKSAKWVRASGSNRRPGDVIYETYLVG
jgi:hypothetical protein